MSTIRAALVTTKFPYNFDELSSTVVINKGLATQRLGRGDFNSQDSENSEGIPQAYYLDNVLPISRGFTSVSYTQMMPPIPGNPYIFDMFTLRDGASGLAYLAVGFETQYIYDTDTLEWVTVNLDAFAPGTVTVATVKGVSYIGVGQVGLYQYNFATKVLDQVTVLGLDVGEILGWFGAGANLCAWTINRLFWSSNLNPLDFVPSLSTGAGSSSILAISSEIVTCLTLGEDFIIYTSTNAVAGRQTGNVQFPFTFSEVVNSVGISSQYHVAYNANSGVHIAWTPLGFQQVNVQEANFIWAELRDGITRGIQILLDPVQDLPYVHFAESLDIRMSFAGNSCVMVSIKESGTTEDSPFTEAYVFDTNLKRWGRLSCEHRTFFQYTVQNIEGRYTYAELEADYINYNAIDNHTPPLAYSQIESNPIPAAGVPGASFGVLGVDGRVHVMAPQQTSQFRGDNEGITCTTPRIFLGRYKVIEEEGVVLQQIQLNKMYACELLAHAHGVNGDIIKTRYDWIKHPTQKGVWYEELAADSVSIELAGSFILTDLSVECISSGTNNPLSPEPKIPFLQYIIGNAPNPEPYSPGDLIVTGRWDSNMYGQGIDQGFIPALMPTFNVQTRTYGDVYQRPRLVAVDGTTEYKGFAGMMVLDDLMISGSITADYIELVDHFVAITPYESNAQIKLEEDWQVTTLVAGTDYKLYDIGYGWIVKDIFNLGNKKILIAIANNDLNAEPSVMQLPIINYTDQLTGTMEFITIDLVANGLDAGAHYSYASGMACAINMETGETTLQFTAALNNEGDFIEVFVKVDTDTLEVLDFTTADVTPYTTPSPLRLQSAITEYVFEHRGSSYNSQSMEVSYRNAYMYYTSYGGDLPIADYDNRTLDPEVYNETVYNGIQAPIGYDLAGALGAKLIDYGFTITPIYPGYPENSLRFGALSGYIL